MFRACILILIILGLIAKQFGLLFPVIQVWQFGFMLLYNKVISNQFYSQAIGLAWGNLLFYNPF